MHFNWFYYRTSTKRQLINNINLNTANMKKVIVIIVIGTFLTSCAGGWSCKKRYCKATDKNAKTEFVTLTTQQVIVQP